MSTKNPFANYTCIAGPLQQGDREDESFLRNAIKLYEKAGTPFLTERRGAKGQRIYLWRSIKRFANDGEKAST